jgi:hypothetical protein
MCELTSTTEELDEYKPHVRRLQRIQTRSPAEILLLLLELSILFQSQ